MNGLISVESSSEASRLRKTLSAPPFAVGYIRKTDSSWTTYSKESPGVLLNISMATLKSFVKVQPSDVASKIVT